MSQGRDPAIPRSFGTRERIRRRPEFQRVHEQGVRTSGRFMTVLFLPNGLPHDRLGVIASRRIGNAVRRNKAKRLIREIFRLNKQRPAGWDLVVIPKPELPDADFTALEADFRSIRHRHGKRVRA